MGQIRQSKLHEQLAAELACQIVSGRLSPGASIPSEPELVNEFGVSKTVVRETVQALAAAGLVRIHHGKRTTVLPEEEWNILHPLGQAAYRTEGLAPELIQELYAVRIVLEPKAARWACINGRPQDMKALQAHLEDMRESLAAADLADFLEHDRLFHLAVADASRNRVLRAIVRDIHEVILTSWLLTRPSMTDMETVYVHHAAIVEAVAARSQDEAEAAMTRHLEWARRTDAALKDSASRSRPVGVPS